MVWLPCPYLGRDVDLTAERERHVRKFHPDLLPAHRDELAETLAAPDQVRFRQSAPDELLFVREFDDLGEKPHIVVVVVTASSAVQDHDVRDWVVTGYRTPEPNNLGDVTWEKD